MSPAVSAPASSSRGDAASAPNAAAPGPSAAVSVSTLIAETLPGMSSTNALTRTQSSHRLERSLPSLSDGDRTELAAAISARLSALQSTDIWQVHAGALLAAVHAAPLCASLHAAAQSGALAAITHAEPRVRAVASMLLAAVARARGAPAWQCCGALLAVVRARFEIGADARLAEAGRVAAREAGARAAGHKLHDVSIVHETEGWKGLETALLALRGVVDGCGSVVLAGATRIEDVDALPAMLDYVARARGHENRFVREAGLHLLNALVGAAPESLLPDVGRRGAESIAAGLQDNWSQVRYAASAVTRALLSRLPADERRAHYPKLLPRMCLNRHYVAEGVRVLAQATWTEVIGADGRDYLHRLLPDVVGFYETQCAADNHAVREAACQSLGEMTTKLNADAVAPLVPRIIAALVECFKDESWPVRDHACRALSAVLAAFPSAASSTGRLPELYELFHAHLADNIPSVRANCAEALVLAAVAFPHDHPTFGLRRILAAAQVLLARAPAQAEHHSAQDARDRHTGYGAAAKLARDNDVALHTGQVMYSCGSLAPKLRRGGGCMDHGFSRPKQPWEEADGGARLWRRVAETGAAGAELARDALPQVAAAARVAADVPFAHQMAFAEALWSEIAAGVACIGSADAEGSEETVQTLVAAVEKQRRCGHKRVESAAAAAMRSIRKCVGMKRYAEAERAAKKSVDG